MISDKQDIISIDIRGLLEPLFPKQELEIRYYGVKRISHSKDFDEEMSEKANRFSDNLRRFKNYLTKNKVAYIPKGSLKARSIEPCRKCGYSAYRFQEKGVDVGLAIDLVSDTILGKTKKIALLSSDTDLLPALQIIKDKNIDVTYISFSGQATVSLIKASNHHLSLRDLDVCNAYIRSLN